MAKRSLLEVCVSRAGYVKGAMVCEFVVEWAIATRDLGHEPSINEFAHWWRDRSDRTAWRRLKTFKSAFPEFATPAPLAAQLLRTIDEKATRSQLMGARVAIA